MVKRLKKFFIVTTFLATIAFCAIVFISYSVVKRFIFRRVHKHEWLAQTTKFNEQLRNQHGATPVSFTSVGDMTLKGLLFVRPQAERNILMCHGYSRSKERLYYLIQLFPNDNILIFDYRAHGESQGDYTTIGFYEKDDVSAAFNFLQSHKSAQQLPTFGIGVSMGAVSLLGAAADGTPFKALILDSAFKQLDEQVAKMFPEKTGLPLMPFMNFCHRIFEYLCNCSMCDVNVIDWAQKVNIPILIIHSNHDTMADVRAAHELYDAVSGQKRLWIVDGAHHAGIYKKYPDEYLKQVTSFLESVK